MTKSLNCDTCNWIRHSIQKRKDEIAKLESNLHSHNDGEHFG